MERRRDQHRGADRRSRRRQPQGRPQHQPTLGKRDHIHLIGAGRAADVVHEARRGGRRIPDRGDPGEPVVEAVHAAAVGLQGGGQRAEVPGDRGERAGQQHHRPVRRAAVRVVHPGERAHRGARWMPAGHRADAARVEERGGSAARSWLPPTGPRHRRSSDQRPDQQQRRQYRPCRRPPDRHRPSGALRTLSAPGDVGVCVDGSHRCARSSPPPFGGTSHADCPGRRRRGADSSLSSLAVTVRPATGRKKFGESWSRVSSAARPVRGDGDEGDRADHPPTEGDRP